MDTEENQVWMAQGGRGGNEGLGGEEKVFTQRSGVTVCYGAGRGRRH